jgi:dCTP deaminase
MPKTGVLPSQMLRDLMHGGFIQGIPEDYINPASLDLPLDEEAYRLECLFLPLANQSVRVLLTKVGATRHDLKSPLEVGVPYLIKVNGAIGLQDGMYGYANPKSSTGRINLFVRTVADGEAMYDALRSSNPEQPRELWVLARADSFPVLLSPGQAVSQMRFFTGKGFLDTNDLQNAVQRHGLLYHPNKVRYTREEHQRQRHADTLFLSARVSDGEVGWECRGVNTILDFGKKKCYRPEKFFTPVEARGGLVKLRKGSFYILSTDECVRVPPEYSAELRATDQRLANGRVHAAGFIDSGWGWGKDGDVPGRPITLEVNPNEDNILLQHGQNVARIRYEWMHDIPEKLYDEVSSHYTAQTTALLSKHFVV